MKHEMRKRKARGGETEDREWDGKDGTVADDKAPTEVYAGKGHVTREAEGEMVNERDEEKRGGRAKRKKGGKAECKSMGGEAEERSTHGRFERKEKKRGGHVAKMEGKGAKHRLDRPGRKRGGGVGSDSSPLTSAARTHDRRGDDEDAVTGGV